MITKSNRPPSRAGIGRIFIIARFIEIIAVKKISVASPIDAASPTTLTIPIGPATSSKFALKVKIICVRKDKTFCAIKIGEGGEF